MLKNLYLMNSVDFMTDYSLGIAYGTGYIAKENGKKFLFVRNLDPYYSKIIESEVTYKSYSAKHNIYRDGKPQWCIKVRNISKLPEFSEINNIQEFIRAYMELHSIIDLMNTKDRKGNKNKKLRLRIYGNEKIISWINYNLPANKKKIQYIRNIVASDYIGETCCIYYQSKKEIFNILNWIDGSPKNIKVWNKWRQVIHGLKE